MTPTRAAQTEPREGAESRATMESILCARHCAQMVPSSPSNPAQRCNFPHYTSEETLRGLVAYADAATSRWYSRDSSLAFRSRGWVGPLPSAMRPPQSLTDVRYQAQRTFYFLTSKLGGGEATNTLTH